MKQLGKTGQELTHLYHVNFEKPPTIYTDKTIPRFISTITSDKKLIEPVYTIYTFPYDIINRDNIIRAKSGRQYLTDFATFDIETSNVSRETNKGGDPYAYMYIWMMCLNGVVIMGRTWEEWLYFIYKLKDLYDLKTNKQLVIYVHNLGFEFQFMKNFLPWENIFCRSPHKIMKATSSIGIEFRCSYFLSNRSLEQYTKALNVKHRKVKDIEFDEQNGIENYNYDIIRYPWDALTELEYAYCYNDVMGLYECILHELENDTLITIPVTSTGYVRRDVRNAVKSKKYTKFLRDIALDEQTYPLMKEAFRGGDTHACYLYTGKILEDIVHADISSSYPYVIMVKKFPMTKFLSANIRNFENYINDKDTACIFRLRLEGVKLKNHYSMPYLPYAKCRNISNPILDNGRIIDADSLEITVTDIDYRIIIDCYSFKSQYVSNLYISRYGYLPEGIRMQTLNYFDGKCTLKNADVIEYIKSKNKLNGIYGMMVTDLLIDEWSFDEDWNAICKKADVKEGLEAHYNSYSLFLAYQWGIWVTAWARYRLHEGRKLFGDDVIYNDTDSIFAFRQSKDVLKSYNQMSYHEALTAPIPPIVKHNGKVFVMGQYEYEDDIERYITWGAKKYATEINGKIETTVAGLSKKIGAEVVSNNGLEAFKPGLNFSPSGNLTAYYNDCEPYYIQVGEHKFLSSSNLALFDADYILDITGEYLKLIKK